MKKLTYSSLAAALWGCWILNPAWESFAVSKAFTLMSQIAPEPAWGAGALAVGLLGLFASLTNRLRLEMFTAFLLLLVWVTITLAFSFSAISSTASVNYVLPALLAIDGYGNALTQWRRSKQ